nr:adenylyltransferase/cytidyltransferase family protein [Verrucomicrobium spinosum]
MITHRFQHGLVVGKFCPLHKGHEAVIRRALEECENVVVLSYTVPEFPGCEPEKRAAWLGSLFPETTRIVLGADHPWGLVPPPNDDPDESRTAGLSARCAVRCCAPPWTPCSPAKAMATASRRSSSVIFANTMPGIARWFTCRWIQVAASCP